MSERMQIEKPGVGRPLLGPAKIMASVILSAWVERVGVSRMRDFFLLLCVFGFYLAMKDGRMQF